MKTLRLTTVILLPFFTLSLLTEALRSSVSPQLVMTVDSEIDDVDAMPGDGLCRTQSGFCTLRAAVQETNATVGEDIILLPAGVYSLTLAPATAWQEEQDAAAGDLDILDSLRISGGGADATIVDGNDLDRVFQVLTDTVVSIIDITIRNGAVDGRSGGGIWNQGTLSMTGSAIQANSGSLGQGGGIYNSGILTLTDVLMAENDAGDVLGASVGGGLANAGRAIVLTSAFRGNRSGNGPAIYNEAGAWIQIKSSTIEHNVGTGTRTGGGPKGGGILNRGVMHLSQSFVFSNTASVVIFTDDDGSGGGIHGSGLGSVSFITNTTIANNVAAFGGGLWTVDGAAVGLAYSTAAFNVATHQGHNLATGDLNSTIFVFGSIIAGSTVNCENNVVLLGYNIDSGNACGFANTGDQAQTDPRLTALAYYGGSTRNYGLAHFSPAIDAADNSRCPAVDQRGVARPVDGDGDNAAVCDIGAFEFVPGPLMFLPAVRME